MALGTPAALGAVCEHSLCWGVTGCPPRCWLAGAGDPQLPPAPLTPLSPQAQRHVNDLYEDLRDGHNLISLLEVLSGDTLVGATLPCPALFPTPRHAPVPLRRPSSSSSSSSPSLPASVPSLPAWPSVCPSDPRAPAPPAPASNLSLLWCPLCFLAPAPGPPPPLPPPSPSSLCSSPLGSAGAAPGARRPPDLAVGEWFCRQLLAWPRMATSAVTPARSSAEHVPGLSACHAPCAVCHVPCAMCHARPSGPAMCHACPSAILVLRLHAVPVPVPPEPSAVGVGFPGPELSGSSKREVISHKQHRWERSLHAGRCQAGAGLWLLAPQQDVLLVLWGGWQGGWHRGHKLPRSHARAGPGPEWLQVHIGPLLWDGVTLVCC